jgi:Integrase core domain
MVTKYPTDSAFDESFNVRVRAECLNAHVFESLDDTKNILINWGGD